MVLDDLEKIVIESKTNRQCVISLACAPFQILKTGS